MQRGQDVTDDVLYVGMGSDNASVFSARSVSARRCTRVRFRALLHFARGNASRGKDRRVIGPRAILRKLQWIMRMRPTALIMSCVLSVNARCARPLYSRYGDAGGRVDRRMGHTTPLLAGIAWTPAIEGSVTV